MNFFYSSSTNFCRRWRRSKWNIWCMIHIKYREKEIIINGEYYTNPLDWFNDNLKKRPLYLPKTKVLFHQNNGRVHTWVVVIKNLMNWLRTAPSNAIFSTFTPPVTFSCFQICTNTPAKGEWVQTMKSSHEQTPVLRPSATFIIWKKLETLWTMYMELEGDNIEKSVYHSRRNGRIDLCSVLGYCPGKLYF